MQLQEKKLQHRLEPEQEQELEVAQQRLYDLNIMLSSHTFNIILFRNHG